MHRNLSVRTAWSGLAYKNGLFPIWIAAYDYRGAAYRFLVNGQTGDVAGESPVSWQKTTLLIAKIRLREQRDGIWIGFVIRHVVEGRDFGKQGAERSGGIRRTEG